MTALEHIRRRIGTVARVMLPLLAIVWLNPSAACAGMTAHDAAAELGRAGDSPPDHALHGPADRDVGDGVHSHAHRGSGDSATPHSGPPHDHGDCPHCPTSLATGGLESDHVVCSVSDGAVATATVNMAAQWDLKPFLSPIAWIAPVAAAPPARLCSTSTQVAAVPHARSLNVRYCVLLL